MPTNTNRPGTRSAPADDGATVSTHVDALADRDIDHLLESVRHRLRRVLILDRLEHRLPVAAMVALVLVVASRLVVAPWLVALAAVVVVVACVVAFVEAWRVGLSDRVVAEVTDHQVGSRDALATALEFADLPGSFGDQIRSRAKSLARATRPDDVTRVAPARRPWTIVAVAGVTVVVVLLTTSAKVHVPTSDELAVESFKADAEELREQAEELRADTPSPDAESLAEQLDALAEQLEQATTLEEGLASLDQAKSKLDASISDNFAAEQAAAQGLEQSLQNNPMSATGGDAAQQLADLAEQLEELSDEQRAELADRLEAAAATQTAGNPALASALSDASAALSNGDLSGAATSLSAASAAQSNASQSVSDQAARSDASQSASDAASHAKQAASSSQSGKGQGQGSGDGDGDGDGQGEGNGESQGKGQGQGGSGPGQGPGQGGGAASGNVVGAPGGTGQGKGGVGQANGRGNSEEVGNADDATVWQPGGESDELNVSAGNQGGESEEVGKANATSSKGGARVPVSDVIADYQQQATEALDREQIPPSSRDLVQRYFDQLGGNAD